MRRRFATLVVIVGLGAHADVLDHKWCRTVSDSFNLYSDLPLAKARALTSKLEQFRLTAATLIPGGDVNPPPLRVIVFRNPQDFAQVFGMARIAGFMQPSLQRHTLAFGPDRDGGYVTRVAFHEYTHFLLRSRTAINLPIWYEEGFANFLSTMTFEDDGTTRIGLAPTRKLRMAARSRSITLHELIGERHGLDWSRHDLSRVYEKAWALVHFLRLGHLAGKSDYAQHLDEIMARVDAGSTFIRAFEEVAHTDVATLQRELESYVKRRKLPVREISTKRVGQIHTDQSCLDHDEIGLLLAQVALEHSPGFAIAQLSRILRREPDNIAALVALSRAKNEDGGAAYSLVKTALDLDAEHPDANVRMAELTMSTCTTRRNDFCVRDWREASAYYRKALATSNSRVDAAYGLGVVYLHVGQPGDAVNYLRIAYNRAPWAPRINFYLGEAYRLTGQTHQARKHLTKAMHWDSAKAWRDRANMALAMVGLSP